MTWYARKIHNATFDWITFKVVKYDLQTKMYLPKILYDVSGKTKLELKTIFCICIALNIQTFI